MIKPIEKDEWILNKLELEFKTYGEYEGKYIGKISFRNGEFESFSFKIKPDMAKPYIELISKDIVDCAQNLGDRLIKSLGLEKD